MDAGSLGGRVRTWVKERFAGQETISRTQLLEASHHADLPEEIRLAIADLDDDGPWTQDRAIHRVVGVLETRAGGGARGNANIPGAGGYGRQV